MGKFDIVKRGVSMHPGEYPDYFEKLPRPKRGPRNQKPKSKKKK